MKLTVITPTYRRPKPLEKCILQRRAQDAAFDVEHIVISDGPDEKTKAVCERFPEVIYVALREKHGGKGPGDAGRDLGAILARGEYLCYWNDDNIYYPHALSSLIEAADGFDIGVCQVKQFKFGHGEVIPGKWKGRWKYADIDAACVCVRATLARKAQWTAANDVASDIRWLEALERFEPTKNFTPVVIGEHH